jgi:hypothetical protein
MKGHVNCEAKCLPHTLGKKKKKVSTSHGFDAELSHLTRFSLHAQKA